jgi:hypothetical protein
MPFKLFKRDGSQKGVRKDVGIGSTPTVDWGAIVLVGLTVLILSTVFFIQKFLTVDSIGITEEQGSMIVTRGINLGRLDQALKIIDSFGARK